MICLIRLPRVNSSIVPPVAVFHTVHASNDRSLIDEHCPRLGIFMRMFDAIRTILSTVTLLFQRFSAFQAKGRSDTHQLFFTFRADPWNAITRDELLLHFVADGASSRKQ